MLAGPDRASGPCRRRDRGYPYLPLRTGEARGGRGPRREPSRSLSRPPRLAQIGQDSRRGALMKTPGGHARVNHEWPGLIARVWLQHGAAMAPPSEPWAAPEPARKSPALGRLSHLPSASAYPAPGNSHARKPIVRPGRNPGPSLAAILYEAGLDAGYPEIRPCWVPQ